MPVFIEKSVAHHPPAVPISAYADECDADRPNWPLVLSTRGLRETADNRDTLHGDLGRIKGGLNVRYGADWQDASTRDIYGTSDYLRDETADCAAFVCNAAEAFIDDGGRIENSSRTGLIYASMTPETRLTVYPGLKLHHTYFSEVAVPYGLSQVGGNTVVTALKLAGFDLTEGRIQDAYVFTADKFRLPVPRAIRNATFFSDAASALHVTTAPRQPLFRLELAHVERRRSLASDPQGQDPLRFAELAQDVDSIAAQLLGSSSWREKGDLRLWLTGLAPRANTCVRGALVRLGWHVRGGGYRFDTCNANIPGLLHEVRQSQRADAPSAQLIVNLCASGTIGFVLLTTC